MNQIACPNCRTLIDSGAVLCVSCGYHLKLKVRLTTEYVGEMDAPASVPSTLPESVSPQSQNPYAPFEQSKRSVAASRHPVFDLTDEAAQQAQTIVADAQVLPWVLIASFCVCTIPILLAFPYYVNRLIQWHSLDNNFSELHQPNSFAPHGKLAAEFQDAWLRLVIGSVLSGLICVPITLLLLINLLVQLSK